jgi:hypothetical protein
MIVKDADWKDAILTEHAQELIVRLHEDGSRTVYRPGCPPSTTPKHEPLYANKPEANRG